MHIAEDKMLGLGTGLLGLILLASSALSADLAHGHLATLGRICGEAAPHCVWCYAALAFALAGAGALALAALISAPAD